MKVYEMEASLLTLQVNKHTIIIIANCTCELAAASTGERTSTGELGSELALGLCPFPLPPPPPPPP